jgi:hypothetical protein
MSKAKKVLKIMESVIMESNVKVDYTDSTISFTFESTDDLVQAEKVLNNIAYGQNIFFHRNGDKEVIAQVINPGGIHVSECRKIIVAINDKFGSSIPLPSGF